VGGSFHMHGRDENRIQNFVTKLGRSKHKCIDVKVELKRNKVVVC
jgi:hypothetical protein